MIEDTLLSIENDLYELVGKIDYGEISNIESYWVSLSLSLGNLKEFGYTVEDDPGSLYSALRPFLKFMDKELRTLARDMETLCQGGGSSDTIDEDDIDMLQSDAVTFEKKFLQFIGNIREEHG